MDVLRRLAELGGAARRSDLVASPADGRQVRALVEHGLVVAHGAGCYSLPDAPTWAVRARQFRGALTCVSWAAQAGIFVLERTTRTHLAVPAGRSPSQSPNRSLRTVVLHRTSTLRPGALPEPPVVAPPVAAACILRCITPLSAIVTIDSFLNRSVCSLADIRSALIGPGSRRARELLSQCDARSESGLETIGRVVLREAGLSVECNVHVAGVGWVDLLVDERVVVEFDGFEHHASLRAFGEDRRRDRALTALGFRVLRFTYDEVVHTPEAIVEAVRAALKSPWVPLPLPALSARGPRRGGGR